MFKKEINPYSVADKAIFRNVDKTLTLYVRADASGLVVRLKKAQDMLKMVSDDSTEAERLEAARSFASAVFGDKQAGQLVEFYGDPIAIISAVGIYFDKQLKYKITKAQKRK